MRVMKIYCDECGIESPSEADLNLGLCSSCVQDRLRLSLLTCDIDVGEKCSVCGGKQRTGFDGITAFRSDSVFRTCVWCDGYGTAIREAINAKINPKEKKYDDN